MDSTSVIMRLMGTLSRLDLVSVDFQQFLLLRMSVTYYVEKAKQEATPLAP
jgi:hypothetical protein